MKIYVISLKDSNERRSSIIEQLKRHGLDYDIIDAINGREIPENLLHLLKKKNSYAITPGEIGCSLSHLLVYSLLVASDEKIALILEDDVILPDGINYILQELERKVPITTPCITLLSKINHFCAKACFTVKESYTIHEVYHAAFTHAYIINKKAAHKLLDKLFPVWCVADQWSTFREFGFVKIFGIMPPCINTHPIFEKITTIADRNDPVIQEQKRAAWAKMKSSRPLLVRLKKAFFLLFKRPFTKIIKL